MSLAALALGLIFKKVVIGGAAKAALGTAGHVATGHTIYTTLDSLNDASTAADAADTVSTFATAADPTDIFSSPSIDASVLATPDTVMDFDGGFGDSVSANSSDLADHDIWGNDGPRDVQGGASDRNIHGVRPGNGHGNGPGNIHGPF